MTVSAELRNDLEDAANRMRISAIEMTCASKSGHPTSSTSAGIFTTSLIRNVQAPIGHACPILYAAWEEAGLLSREQVMTLRKVNSDIEGHPTPRLNFIDVATGSLGQGLSCAAGMAYVGKYMDKASYRVYCLLGDGETAEGSVWEAAAFSSYYKLDNLVAIVDVNRLGQSQETALGHHVEVYQARFAAFGFNAIVVNGHDVSELISAYETARNTKDKPTAIICKTIKGQGIEGIADMENWHGKPVPHDKINPIKARLHGSQKGKLVAKKPVNDAPAVDLHIGSIQMAPPTYKMGEKVATRAAYGTALAKLGDANPRVIGLDGDTKNSTFSEKLLHKHPQQFIECFIAEQNLVGVAVGTQCRDRAIPFTSTFAAFFTRATDQIRMAAVSFANLKCVGSHVGVSIGEDGPSQMALEVPIKIQTCPSSELFPDQQERRSWLRTSGESFSFSSTRTTSLLFYRLFQVLKESGNDKIVLIGAGVTLYECLKAAEQLEKDGIHACVIDPFTIKPLDQETIVKHAKRVGGRILTVEDHYPAGGIGEAVSSAVADHTDIRVRSICVHEVARSGSPEELMDLYGISARHIVEAAKKF
ncbi:unnamed protein product [Heligmosomoides polygyrus]|uniref:transketolase n=1 Tax=Heligmosomoides polygyrus TaxID=6339 RepID=A0A183GND1_HELPZ|nr:unnamed protein product [Heligmosomoides polygyrus]